MLTILSVVGIVVVGWLVLNRTLVLIAPLPPDARKVRQGPSCGSNR